MEGHGRADAVTTTPTQAPGRAPSGGPALAMQHPSPAARRPPPPVRRARLTPVDFALFALVTAVIAYVVWRVNDVLVYRWDWPRVLNFVVYYDPAREAWAPNLLLFGVATTLRLAFWGTLLATLIGVVMGFCRTSENMALAIVSRAYVELIRNIPPLVFIFIFYFFISSQIFPALGVDRINPQSALVDNPLFAVAFGNPKLLSNFLSGMLCLALFEGAYVTEIVRAGVQSVEKGQWEAARAIGLTRFNVLRDVILPQAVRRILPPWPASSSP